MCEYGGCGAENTWNCGMMFSILKFLKQNFYAWILFMMSLFCFSTESIAAPKVQGYVMQVQMTPAVCAIDGKKKKQRKCLEGYSLTVTGLVPEVSQTDCTTNSSATLPPLQAKVVARIMPEESARTQLWRNVGGCVPSNASQYFRTLINFADRLKIPTDLTSAENKKIQYSTLRSQFVRLNPGMSANSIRFNCQNLRAAPVLTEVQVCYQVNGQFKQCSTHVQSTCPNSFSIQGAY